MNPLTHSRNSCRRIDPTHTIRIREKFREVFGTVLTLPDEVVMQRYSLTNEGDLVMILR